MQTTIKMPFVLEAVKKAGDLFLRDYKTNTIPQTRAELIGQLDYIDKRCLNVLQSDLEVHYPEIPFRGNEFDFREQSKAIDQDDYWLCDFMDGAIQYLQHIAGWTINLVLVRGGQPYCSVIYDPVGGELFWAMAGQGAFMNGHPIKPSLKKDTSVMVAVFEYGHQESGQEELYRKTGEAVTNLLHHFGVVRNYGPHGLQLAYVGAGRIDLFYQEGQDAYNWLAGVLIAKEAGAEVMTTTGKSWTWGDDSLMVASPEAGKAFIKTTFTSSKTR